MKKKKTEEKEKKDSDKKVNIYLRNNETQQTL